MWIFHCAFQSILLAREVLLCTVEVQNAILQTEEIYQLGQVGLSSFNGDIWLQLIQSRLGTTPPLVNQDLELC